MQENLEKEIFCIAKYFQFGSMPTLHCASTLNVARGEAAFQLRISVYLWLFNIDFL